MAEQDDFTFDEQESDSEEWYEEEPEKKAKKGGSRRRLLLLLLLLLVIAAGGYYFMMMPQDEGPGAPPKAVVKVKKQPVAMPAKPPVGKPAPASPEKGTQEQPAEKPEPKPMPVKAADTAPQPAQPAPAGVAEKPAPAPAPSPAAAPVKPEAETAKVFETPAEKPAADLRATGGAYTLTAGTFLFDSSVRNVSGKIRALGYEPVVSPVKGKVSMTRLKVGTYPLAEAAAKKAELKPLAPGVFGIREGEKETVYAGSFLVVDKARHFSDRMYARGIRLEEVPVEVEKTLQRVTFGAFADTDAAATAARQARSGGVEAKVVKNR